MRRSLAAVLLVLLACSSTPASKPRASSSAPVDPAAFVGMSKAVTFRSSDGLKLAGRLATRGDTAIALMHMGGGLTNLTDWFPLGIPLANAGITVLTFDRRGTCPGGVAGCSEAGGGEEAAWKDFVGAVSYLRGLGMKKIFVGGASLGAIASLRAAEAIPTKVAGVIWVAGLNNANGYSFARADLNVLHIPQLYMAGADDVYDAAPNTRQVYDLANQPKKLILLPSSLHGTDMISARADVERAQFIDAVLSFVRNPPK